MHTARQHFADELQQQHSRVTEASRILEEEDEKQFQQQLSLALVKSEAEARANDAETPSIFRESTAYIKQQDTLRPEQPRKGETGVHSTTEDVLISATTMPLDTSEPDPDVQCSVESPESIASISTSSSQQGQAHTQVPADGTMVYEQRVAYVPEQRESIQAVYAGQYPYACAASMAPMAPSLSLYPQSLDGVSSLKDASAAEEHRSQMDDGVLELVGDLDIEDHDLQIVDDAEIAESRSPDQTESVMDAERPQSVHRGVVAAHASNSEVNGATESSPAPPLGTQESVGPGVRIPTMTSRVPQRSIMAHITVNYGVCARDSDLEGQDSGRDDGDASRRRRSLLWRIVWRIVCLVSKPCVQSSRLECELTET